MLTQGSCCSTATCLWPHSSAVCHAGPAYSDDSVSALWWFRVLWGILKVTLNKRSMQQLPHARFPSGSSTFLRVPHSNQKWQQFTREDSQSRSSRILQWGCCICIWLNLVGHWFARKFDSFGLCWLQPEGLNNNYSLGNWNAIHESVEICLTCHTRHRLRKTSVPRRNGGPESLICK